MTGSGGNGSRAGETLVHALAGLTAGLRYADIPEEVVRSVRERVLDTLGIELAASRLETSAMARSVARTWGVDGAATSVFWGDHLPSAGAAFVNGTLAHSLDFDDTHLPSVLHPSASIVPGLLALAQEERCGWDELIAAAAAAYEINIRVGMAAYDRELGNSIFFERGWHATSICGTLAVAAGGARLLGLGADGIGHALGIAASMAGGIIEGNRAGGSVKRLHCGWAAHAGVVAAQCARAGLTGPPTALEGRFGFYEAFCSGRFETSEILDGLGTTWSIPGIFYKPYPANHFTHAGIDAALALRSEVNLDDIDEITLGVPAPVMRTIAEPREQKIRPQSGYHAQFSGPFTVAAALMGGGGLGLALEDFTDRKAHDPRYLALAEKVRVVADERCNEIFPKQFPGVLRITMRDGRSLEHRVDANRGGPGRPLSADELKTKFMSNATRALPEPQASELAGAIVDDPVTPGSPDQIARVMKLATAI